MSTSCASVAYSATVSYSTDAIRLVMQSTTQCAPSISQLSSIRYEANLKASQENLYVARTYFGRQRERHRILRMLGRLVGLGIAALLCFR